jgi:hypothetical protein
LEKIMRDFGLVGVALFTLTVSSQIAAADGMNSGQWHISTQGTTTMGGQKMDLPKNEMDSCVTPQQAKQATDAAAAQPQTDCKTETLSKSGNQTKTRTTCPTSVTTTDFLLSPNDYTSVTHMEMKQGETQIVTDMTAIGQRVGDCTQ